ncbi:hypothetical protein BC830DRAFT_640589 [Chytriomyces sp. MP71]|nr:hypothetical protein BC830DRAFT_640589 [Chytriomyces sp. MP71]
MCENDDGSMQDRGWLFERVGYPYTTFLTYAHLTIFASNASVNVCKASTLIETLYGVKKKKESFEGSSAVGSLYGLPKCSLGSYLDTRAKLRRKLISFVTIFFSAAWDLQHRDNSAPTLTTNSPIPQLIRDLIHSQLHNDRFFHGLSAVV